MKKPKNALVIVDVQNDFCIGGALEVPDGDLVVPVINRISPKFYKVVASQDWHPAGHISFASRHNKQLYETVIAGRIRQVLWPDHCVQGTHGSEIHRDIDLNPVGLIIRKGAKPDIDSYSVFLENDKKTVTGLHHYLKGLGIKNVYFCGLATDYCVYFSATDAKKFGFNSCVIIDASRGVDVPAGNVAAALAEMKKKGVKILTENDVEMLHFKK